MTELMWRDDGQVPPARAIAPPAARSRVECAHTTWRLRLGGTQGSRVSTGRGSLPGKTQTPCFACKGGQQAELRNISGQVGGERHGVRGAGGEMDRGRGPPRGRRAWGWGKFLAFMYSSICSVCHPLL